MVGRSGTATEIDIETVDAVIRNENKIGMTLLRCGTIIVKRVPQLNTQSEIFEGDALEMVILPFLCTG